MTIATTKLTAAWCFRSRGCRLDVHTFRVAQGRTVPFFGKTLTRSWS